MSAWLKSRRLRRRALLRWALLALPLAFLVSRIWSVDGLSALALFWWIVCIALLPFLLIHIVLGSRIHRRKTSRAIPSIIVPVESVKAEVLKADTKTTISPVDSVKAEVLKASTKATNADTKTFRQSVMQSITEPEIEDGPEAGTAGTNLDASCIIPEDLQLQVEAVGDVVQTHDLSDDDLVRVKGASATLADKARPDISSIAGTSLITATSHADTAELSALTHTEATQLVATLQKDKTRLHRLVIEQRAAMDSERRAHDRSRLVARDAIKIMRDSREGQKKAEKLARREHSERKRLEGEYRKVSTALDNAKSIIAS